MQSPEASTAATPTQIHLALAALADEIVGTLARLFAYVGALVLFAILALAALDQLPSLRDDEPAEKPGWSVADRSQPAFALSRLDSSEKTASYVILRHPEGGRRDVMHWTGEADKPVAELEIYREGGEFDVTRPATADLAVHMGESGREAVMINTDQVKKGDLRKFTDLLDPKWKGKIAVLDMTRSGTASNQAAVLEGQFGPEFVDKLLIDQQPVVSTNRRQLTDWTARGSRSKASATS